MRLAAVAEIGQEDYYYYHWVYLIIAHSLYHQHQYQLALTHDSNKGLSKL